MKTLRRRTFAGCALAASALLGGCLGGANEVPPRADATAVAPASAGTDAASANVAPWPLAPKVTLVREGSWLGGPEPVSGKLRSGITTWYRLQPAKPRPDEPFELVLRFEDASAEGATVWLSTSDGARFAMAAAANAWALPANVPSQVAVRLLAPAGNSYVHVMSQQRGRSSVRSILLPLPGINPTAAAQPRKDYAVDARGEPIVRMTSEKTP